MCAVTSALGGSSDSPKSQKGNRAMYQRSLSLSKAAQPPLRDCIPSIHSTPRAMASCRFASSVPSSLAKARAMMTSDESSMSGYLSLWNSKAQPPGGVSLARTCQSPSVRIWLSISHWLDFCTMGSAPVTPDSSSAT